MKLLSFLPMLFAMGKRKMEGTTWIVDGFNLMGHKNTGKKDVDILANNLQQIHAEQIVLVLDGRKGRSQTKVTEHKVFSKIELAEGLIADDFIIQTIKDYRDESPHKKIQVVTADRKLRKAVLGIKPIVKGVVNPVTFWRRYLPRLQGRKKVKEAKAEEEKVDSEPLSKHTN